MALESSGTILYVAKILYQSDNWFGNCWGGVQNCTQTHTHIQTDRHTHIHTHRHTHTDRQTHTHTHTQTHTHGSPFYKSCFSAKMQKQD